MYMPITRSHDEIVYSDTVLNLKDLGENIKVTSIPNISEYELEDCLKAIFESNPSVTFNTIQYSKKDKKVYFYTDNEITTHHYEEGRFTKYKPITSRKDILEEVKNVLLEPKNSDSECISLYDVSIILKKLRYEYDRINKTYEDRLNDIIGRNFNLGGNIIIHDFDYKNEILNASFRKLGFGDYKNISFSKENGDLYVVKSEICYSQEILKVLGPTLSELYDKFLEYSDYKDYKKSTLDIKPVNSRFSVKISNAGLSIFLKNLRNSFVRNFELSSSCYLRGYELNCNSSLVGDAIKEKEQEIFKRIFIKISDCPIWLQDTLYDFRKNQLAEEKKLEDKIKCKEIKKQTRKELVRKLNPFIKK